MTDELAELWVSSSPASPPAVDSMVRAALARRRREWTLTLLQVAVCVGGIVWNGILGSEFSIPHLVIFIVPAVPIALMALVIAVWTHGNRHRLFPDGVLINEASREVGRTRVALWIGGAALVGQLQLLLVFLIGLLIVADVNIMVVVWLLAMVLTAASLAVSVKELQRRAIALTRVTEEARDVSSDGSNGEDPHHRRMLRVVRDLVASATRRLRPAAPGSTVTTPVAPASLAGLLPSATGHGLAAHLAAVWRWQVLTVALCVLPQLMDGLAVLALQTGPRPRATYIGFDVPTLHLVMPYLPLLVTFAVAALLPSAVFVASRIRGHQIVAPSSAPILAALLVPPLILTIPGVFLGENGHLWCYSWKATSSFDGLLGQAFIDEEWWMSAFFVVSIAARLFRAIAVVMVARGLMRVVGSGRLRVSLVAVLAIQLLVWLLTLMAPTPDGWRGLVDILASVSLLLSAVWSQAAIAEKARESLPG